MSCEAAFLRLSAISLVLLVSLARELLRDTRGDLECAMIGDEMGDLFDTLEDVVDGDDKLRPWHVECTLTLLMGLLELLTLDTRSIENGNDDQKKSKVFLINSFQVFLPLYKKTESHTRTHVTISCTSCFEGCFLGLALRFHLRFWPR